MSRVGRALFAGVAVTAIFVPLLYNVLILVSPAITPDGHRVMPIGQALFALVFAPILGAGVALWVGREPPAREP